MKCKRCHRELKNHTESGMGKVCQMKANGNDNSENKTARVEPLFMRRAAVRSYLVFTAPRVIVRVEETGDGRFACCPCSTEMCEHRALVAAADRRSFPVDLSGSANQANTGDFHFQAGEIDLHYENTGYWEAA